MFGDLITGVNIEISDTVDLSSISEMRLVDLYCKHMIRVDYDKESKANRLLSVSRTIGYGYCEWGSHDYSRSNVFHHLGIIEKMEKDEYNHVIRVVVCNLYTE